MRRTDQRERRGRARRPASTLVPGRGRAGRPGSNPGATDRLGARHSSAHISSPCRDAEPHTTHGTSVGTTDEATFATTWSLSRVADTALCEEEGSYQVSREQGHRNPRPTPGSGPPPGTPLLRPKTPWRTPEGRDPNADCKVNTPDPCTPTRVTTGWLPAHRAAPRPPGPMWSPQRNQLHPAGVL